MARKNPFASLMEEGSASELRPALDYTIKGASKSILNSIDEMSARADKLLEGETIIEIDPGLVDPSFLEDRLEDDQAEYAELLDAVKLRGQDSPILIRPHPKTSGRYMIVFGHRRWRVAKDLGRNVRAVVKDLTDQLHAVTQGQENSARANLSFIEKAMFANRLASLQYDNDNATVMSALSIDKSTLSKMLSVSSLPSEILRAIGPAKGAGRDRWYELKILLERPANLDKAIGFSSEKEFSKLASDERLAALVRHIKVGARPNKAAAAKVIRKWAAEDKAVGVDITSDGKSFTLALKAKDAVRFGEYISQNLDSLYRGFRSDETRNQGD
jgi:ParB family chromosome partitioning protein